MGVVPAAEVNATGEGRGAAAAAAPAWEAALEEDAPPNPGAAEGEASVEASDACEDVCARGAAAWASEETEPTAPGSPGGAAGFVAADDAAPLEGRPGGRRFSPAADEEGGATGKITGALAADSPGGAFLLPAPCSALACAVLMASMNCDPDIPPGARERPGGALNPAPPEAELAAAAPCSRPINL